MNIENAIFLGAGASASEGAPLQNNLLKEYFFLDNQHMYYGINDEMNHRLKDFFKFFFGIDTTENHNNTMFPTFEEILGIIELSLSRGETFIKYPLVPLMSENINISSRDTDILRKTSLQQIREDLIFLIAIILDQKLQVGHKHHQKLMNRLQDDDMLIHTSFFSLNYDILIDNALVNLYPRYDLDYGVEFTNYNQKFPNEWKKPRPGKSINLFKLHGSLNWLYCPTCISLTLYEKIKKVAIIATKPEKCKKCNSYMIPIIIPPSFFKVMSNYYLQQLWYKAETILKTVKNIFFCGYSFPDADIHIKYLLKRAEINGNSSPNIYVINNHNRKTDNQKKDEKLRYERFFKDSGKVKYTNLSFEDFSKEGIN